MTSGLFSAGAQTPTFDRPTGLLHQGRSVVLARRGMVATSHPLAAEAALRVLQSGGTAADAAIAANAMLGVVEPMSCGVGGDLFALYWDAKSKRVYGLNASGRAPLKLNRQVFAEMGLEAIPDVGPLSWSTPGCVSGWSELHGRFGRRPMAELLAPAIAAAEEGFPVSEVIAADWRAAEKALKNHPDSAATYLVGGERAPAFGEVFKNPRLAATYRKLADKGPRSFYTGEIAAEIARFSEANGGYLAMEDLLAHKSEWIEPLFTDYRGHRVYELPPNGQGLAALQMLNLLESFDLKALGPAHPEYLHLFIEAKKLAYADRARFYADPAFGELPTQQLVSKEYAARRLKRLDRARAAKNVPPGDAELAHGDTVYITVVDEHRNCCSLIQSVYYGFGSKMVVGDLGFALQNRGALFSLDENHANRLEPGKRPFHTIIPALVTRDDKPWFCFGVMGGDMQPQGHVQVLVNLIDFGMNVQAAGDAARARHAGGAEPTGASTPGSGTVYLESSFPPETAEALRAKGHTVVRARSGYGGYQGVLIDWENNVLHGATESRKDGAALGY